MNWTRTAVLVAMLVLAGGAAALAQVAASGPATTSTASTQENPKLIISKETTYYTGPLKADGTVDYIAAINERWGKGVTPENNAAVLLMRAFDAKKIFNWSDSPRGSHVYDTVFKTLGITPPPADAKFFVPSGDFFVTPKPAPATASLPTSGPGSSQDSGYYDSLIKAMDGPWTAKDYPGIARWLAANEGPLSILAEATKRPRYFIPLVSSGGEPETISVMMPYLGQYRDAARALGARAMLRLGEGDIGGAQADLLTVHRFGRLLSQDQTLIGQLVAIAIDAVASSGDKAMAVSGKLSAKQAMDSLDALKQLPPMGDVVDVIDNGERAFMLDSVALLTKKSIRETLHDLWSAENSAVPAVTTISKTELPVDVNLILRNVNRQYDQLIESARKPTFAERLAAFDSFNKKLDEIRSRVEGTPAGVVKWIAKMALTPPEKRREVVSNDLTNLLLCMLMPTLDRVIVMQDQARQGFQLAELAYALAAYKADKGSYPAALSDLAPGYMKEIPKDIFTEKALLYRQNGKGFILYSAGENMKDDGGKDRAAGGDDIVIKTPGWATTKEAKQD